MSNQQVTIEYCIQIHCHVATSSQFFWKQLSFSPEINQKPKKTDQGWVSGFHPKHQLVSLPGPRWNHCCNSTRPRPTLSRSENPALGPRSHRFVSRLPHMPTAMWSRQDIKKKTYLKDWRCRCRQKNEGNAGYPEKKYVDAQRGHALSQKCEMQQSLYERRIPVAHIHLSFEKGFLLNQARICLVVQLAYVYSSFFKKCKFVK